ncbi:hypothetical protein C9422_18500 [Pseudomonas sp. B1(2018)]|uniref:hypothetical protein n=1 Tax=Pseudomonas sp. B1(2018) TaxID=2233856 RepID=UPI000D5D66D6|nr:hypothetical protein [Pseudomonas sp. B1(2018)]PVZ56514.1 hypothetical protein C9422_18500 [Pseudomonas sp. B1(2018)]
MGRYLEYWNKQIKWWCSRGLDWWAAHITAFYVGGALLVMGAKFDELIALELNEVGDLSAGVFGPVAFLWLVLGYIQQGRELKISSAALNLQAKELKESVDQQKEMVGISTDQLNMAKKNTELENRRLAASVEPKFSLSSGYDGTDAYGVHFGFRLFNGGHTITCYKVLLDDEELHSVGVLDKMQQTGFRKTYIEGETSHGGVVVISYLNGLEEQKFKKFHFSAIRTEDRDYWFVDVSPQNGISWDGSLDNTDM